MTWTWFDIRNLTASDYEKYYALMTPTKRARVERFRYTADKERTVVGDMLARQLISKRCSIDENNIRFQIGKHGKPYVAELSVYFNISHSGNIVVCAIDNKPIGIDVEQIRKIDSHLIKRVCTDKEQEYVLSVKDGNETGMYKRFFEIWTSKEAYFKCIGTGIMEFKEIDIYTEVTKRKSNLLEDYIITIVTS